MQNAISIIIITNAKIAGENERPTTKAKNGINIEKNIYTFERYSQLNGSK